jgi:tRNA(fMet)-specific endonuclease VapC
MVYSLDTNICVGLLKGERTLADRLAELHPTQVAVCSVVRAELFNGARRSGRIEENLSTYRRFLDAFPSASFDDLAAEYYGVIRSDLERAGTPIGNNDLLIASIARAHDWVLVTRNFREFSRVAGLRVELW